MDWCCGSWINKGTCRIEEDSDAITCGCYHSSHRPEGAVRVHEENKTLLLWDEEEKIYFSKFIPKDE
jgi:hypothetical protein